MRTQRDKPKPKKDHFSPWAAFTSVLAAFFGVQKSNILERDFTTGRPSYFIIAGVLLTCALVAIIASVVSWVT